MKQITPKVLAMTLFKTTVTPHGASRIQVSPSELSTSAGLALTIPILTELSHSGVADRHLETMASTETKLSRQQSPRNRTISLLGLCLVRYRGTGRGQIAVSHRLRPTIRNTGHDLAGRSSAPESLQLHTAGLKGIVHVESFTPQAPAGQSAPSDGPAVTVGAGVLTGDLYSAAADGGFTVVGRSCSTVGVAGGWIQGGGYGILTPS